MRKIDAIFLFLGVLATLIWITFSAKDGFKGSNATIIARSLDIIATIDGQVENNPPEVGELVELDDLLLRIHNGRFDRSRLVDFQSQVIYLESQIKEMEEQQQTLAALEDNFSRQAASYSDWMVSDFQIRHREFDAQLDVAKATKRLEDQEAQRAEQLFNKNISSEVEYQIAKTQASIAKSQVDLNTAQYKRSGLKLNRLQQDGAFFDNGDTSYWAKMVDTLGMRQQDVRNTLTMLKAQLVQAKSQAATEAIRTNSSFAEEHRAPFTGMVSAKYVTEGTRVTSGSNLLQILDCSHPITIIPIPENRISDFSVGMAVTVYPIDTDQALPGIISYISSGPMIGSDTSIQIHREVTLEGNRAIVSLDEGQSSLSEPSQACETARKAVVVIHTKTLFNTLSSWF